MKESSIFASSFKYCINEKIPENNCHHFAEFSFLYYDVFDSCP